MNMKKEFAIMLITAMLLSGCSGMNDVVDKAAQSIKEKVQEQVETNETAQNTVAEEEADKTEAVDEETKQEETSQKQGQGFRPVVEYEGVTYEIGMSADSEAMYEKFPREDGSVRVFLRQWERVVGRPDIQEHRDLLNKVEEEGEYIIGFSSEREGTMSNGITVGDSYEKVLEVFPMAEVDQPEGGSLDMTVDKCWLEIVFRDGRLYSDQEYKELFMNSTPDDPETYVPQRICNDFNTFWLSFKLENGKVSGIRITDGLCRVSGH